MTLEQLIQWLKDGKVFRGVDKNGNTVTIQSIVPGYYEYMLESRHGVRTAFTFIEEGLPEILKPFAKK